MSPRRTDSGWRFPGGSAALPPELVGEIQRMRIFEALCLVMAERGGFAKTSVEAVMKHAGMSTKTFYDYFADKDDCLLAAHRFYAAQLELELSEAWAAPADWVAKVRAALAALLAYGESATAQMRFLFVDAASAAGVVLAERRQLGDRLAAKLREGRDGDGSAAGLSPVTEEMVIAAIVMPIGCRLLDGEPLAGLEPALAEFALAPYVGRAQARRVARSSEAP